MHQDQAALVFREEALELLTEAEEILLALEEDANDARQVARLFRAMHTIKGSGAMFGFDEVARFTHEVETILDLARAGKLTLGSELLSLFLLSRDHILALLSSPSSDSGITAASDALIARLRKAAGLPEPGQATPAGAQCPAATPRPAGLVATWWIRYRPHPDSYLTGTNPLMLLHDLDALGQSLPIAHVAIVPALADGDPETVTVWWDVLLLTAAAEDALRDVFVFVEGDHDVFCTRLAEVALRQTDMEEYQALLAASAFAETQELGRTLTECTRQRLARRLARQGAGQASAPERQAEGAPGVASIRVEAGRLDRLVDLVGELVIIQSRLQQTALTRDDPTARAIAEELERVTARLRDETLRIRMVPIGGIFGGLRRLVRDLAGELGKQAVFAAEGGETELDKNVIDRLKDPLVHILRNCVDHGIEPPEARCAAGKPAQGTVRLRAAHDSGEVLIEIQDDGAGVNLERVRRKALEKGLLAPGEEADERRVLECLFAPGFSTAGQVSNVSGRGVGMDVVKESIEALRGRVHLDSTPGAGTRLAMRLPLTLAIIDGMQVRVGREHYIIPLSTVLACQERVAQGQAQAVDAIAWSGRLTPCLSLRAVLGVDGPRPRFERVIMVKVEEEEIGLAVDVVVGQQQAVIKRLSDVYRDVDFVSGTAVNGDGGISLILDVARLVRFATTAARA